MRDEGAFLAAIQANSEDDVVRLVYADWLEDRGDVRGAFLRLHLTLRSLPPDPPYRGNGEQELRCLRQWIDPHWLAVVEPERAHLYEDPPRPLFCPCFKAGYEERAEGEEPEWPEVEFHVEPQDTECDAWKRLLDLIEAAAA